MRSFTDFRSVSTSAVMEAPEPRTSLGPTYERRFPIKCYDALGPADIISRLDGLSNEEMRLVQSYELRHRNRRAVLEEINWRLGEV